MQGILGVVRSVDGDVSEEAVELRRDIGMLMLAQGRTVDAWHILEPLHEDLCVVYRPDDEMTAEISEALALIRLDLDEPGS